MSFDHSHNTYPDFGLENQEKILFNLPLMELHPIETLNNSNENA